MPGPSRPETRGITTGGFVANGMAGPAFGLERGFSRFDEVFRGHGSAADSFRHEFWPWLEQHRAARFFAYAHYREPHFPYDAPASFVARFGPDAPLPAEARTQESFITQVNWGGRELSPEEQAHLVRLYDANLAYADAEIGALRRHLEALGVWDRLLVIVTADHGEALYEHDGFVGHNQQLYEPSVHVPLIVRFPSGRGPAGTRVAGLVGGARGGGGAGPLQGPRDRPDEDAALERGAAAPGHLKGEDLYRINTLVDALNLVSLREQLPFGLYDLDRVWPPVLLRMDAPGEAYEGIRKGAVNVEGRPVLVDSEGAFGNPTSDSLRTSITLGARAALVVAYAPAGFSTARLCGVLDRTAETLSRYCGGGEAARSLLPA